MERGKGIWNGDDVLDAVESGLEPLGFHVLCRRDDDVLGGLERIK